jgi:hypothetical protein
MLKFFQPATWETEESPPHCFSGGLQAISDGRQLIQHPSYNQDLRPQLQQATQVNDSFDESVIDPALLPSNQEDLESSLRAIFEQFLRSPTPEQETGPSILQGHGQIEPTRPSSLPATSLKEPASEPLTMNPIPFNDTKLNRSLRLCLGPNCHVVLSGQSWFDRCVSCQERSKEGINITEAQPTKVAHIHAKKRATVTEKKTAGLSLRKKKTTKRRKLVDNAGTQVHSNVSSQKPIASVKLHTKSVCDNLKPRRIAPLPIPSRPDCSIPPLTSKFSSLRSSSPPPSSTSPSDVPIVSPPHHSPPQHTMSIPFLPLHAPYNPQPVPILPFIPALWPLTVYYPPPLFLVPSGAMPSVHPLINAQNPPPCASAEPQPTVGK